MMKCIEIFSHNFEYARIYEKWKRRYNRYHGQALGFGISKSLYKTQALFSIKGRLEIADIHKDLI